MEQRISDNDRCARDVPSFIEPLPPIVTNPYMRPRPVNRRNLMETFEEESDCEELDLVKVYLRLKPSTVPSKLYEVKSEQKLITCLDTATAGHGRRTQHNVSKMYTFSHIFGPESTQKQIFENVVQDNLRSLLDGQSFTLLMYGASGSGKTYTLMGTVSQPGLVPRSLEYLFKIVNAAQRPLYKPVEGTAEELTREQQDQELMFVSNLRHVSSSLRDKYRRMSSQLNGDFHCESPQQDKHYIWVSFVEIYNEAVYDLLAPGERRAASKLRIREDANGSVYVKGATQAFVRSGAEAYDVMATGKHSLQVAATGVHARSSRSHCIFTVTLLARTQGGGVRAACVRLCDLAGSERAARTLNAGARMAESRAINASLHVLERCLHELRRRRRRAQHLVPYRESKLTRLLGAGLSGARGEAVSMVVTVNPDPAYAAETRHVLQLAAVARDIQVNSTLNTLSTLSTLGESSLDWSGEAGADCTRLRAENERLHYELAQAHGQHQELLATLAGSQQRTAATMRELVDEAKALTRQYYEAQILAARDAHRAEIDELTDEYERKLRRLSGASPRAAAADRDTIAELTKENAILEEQLHAERLARAVAEQEVQHLRECLEERDREKSPAEMETSVPQQDVILLSDNEAHSDGELNESLEPSFRHTLNRTKVDEQLDNSNKSSENEESDTTLGNETNDSLAAHYTEDNLLNKTTKELDENLTSNVTVEGDKEKPETAFSIADLKRGTYFISDIEMSNDSVASAVSKESLKSSESLVSDVNISFEGMKIGPLPNIKKVKGNATLSSDKSLALFEQFEKEMDSEISLSKNTSNRVSIDVNTPSKNRIYFEEDKDKGMTDSFNYKTTSFAAADVTASCEKRTQFFEEKAESITVQEEDKAQELSQGKMDVSADKVVYKAVDEIINISNKEKKTYFDNIVVKLEPEIEQNKTNEIPLIVEDIIQVATETGVPEISIAHLTNDEYAEEFRNIKILKEKKTFFDNISANLDVSIGKNNLRSPSIVKEDVPSDYEPSTITKLLEESMTATTTKKKHLSKTHDTMDLFEDEIISQGKGNEINLNSNHVDFKKPDPPSTGDRRTIKIQVNDVTTAATDNSAAEFDDIYKDITPRDTEFELLLSQNITRGIDETDANTTEGKENENKKPKATSFEEDKSLKYNLRHKTIDVEDRNAEVIAMSKRSLRLRRRKKDDEDLESRGKLKDIANLQKEFSDVVSDAPAVVKEVKDIPSPDNSREQFLTAETQSCPSKSVTRSRRKLFTPRAETLDEDGAPGDSAERRPCVPRPSYHKGRARRKL